MIKQAENKVHIEGILSEVDIKTGETRNEKKPYISGEIKIKVSQDINGKTENIEVPVNLFATKFKRDGGPNPAYTAIENIKDNYVSIAACGSEEEATRIRIDRGELGENAFYGNNGILVSTPRIRTSFTTSLRKDECNEKATFTAVIVIGSIKEEVKNGEVTGRLCVKGILPQYGEKVDVIDFIVASNEAINHIQTYWNEGDTVRIAGKINFSSRVEREEKEVGFGEPIIEEKTVSVKELIITSGSQSALEGDAAYDESEIKAALKERQERLEKSKASTEEKSHTSSNHSTSTDFGF